MQSFKIWLALDSASTCSELQQKSGAYCKCGGLVLVVLFMPRASGTLSKYLSVLSLYPELNKTHRIPGLFQLLSTRQSSLYRKGGKKSVLPSPCWWHLMVPYSAAVSRILCVGNAFIATAWKEEKLGCGRSYILRGLLSTLCLPELLN